MALERAVAAYSRLPCSSLSLAVAARGEEAEITVRVVEQGFAWGETLAAHTEVVSDPFTGVVQRASVELRALPALSDADGPPRPDAIDLESLLLHELGHAIGLAHSLRPEAVMRAGVRQGRLVRSLAEDDVRGVCTLYPPRPRTEPRPEALGPRGGASAGDAAQAQASPLRGLLALAALLLVAIVAGLAWQRRAVSSRPDSGRGRGAS
jgi:hypothetical protein